jgi:hypothetical protein
MKRKLFIEKVSQSTSVSPEQIQRLEGVYRSGNNFALVAGTGEHPPHLIAHGRILHREPVSEIQTAINAKLGQRREDDAIEFSSNVGQVPRTPLGNAVVGRLNHEFDGKFVTFPEETDEADVVYASEKPADSLDDARIYKELENHAKTKVLVNPILRDTINYGQLKPGLTYPEIEDVAQDIVETGLGVQDRLRDRFTPTRYLPIPRRLSEE